mgnify:CR=1 FL=1
MTYTTIRGARQHSAANQQHVDRAVDVLFTEFGEARASPDKLRESLTNSRNILLSSDAGVALVLRAGEVGQKIWQLWVEEKARGQGIGSALLKHIISAYTADHLMELECPAARENFYKRHGFHPLWTAMEGAYVYMAGPAESESDVPHLLPDRFGEALEESRE